MNSERIATELVRTAKAVLAGPPDVRAIQRMTARNDHNGAALELAKALGERRLVKALEAIRVIIDFNQGIPRDLNDMQYKMLKYMLREARRKWGDEVGEAIYQAF